MQPLRHDWRYIPNITSSAIVNAPPPDNLAYALQLFGHAGMTNKHTRNKMVRLFGDHGRRSKVRGRQGRLARSLAVQVAVLLRRCSGGWAAGR